jgi:ring-1,2-phenylacetyl-CoA epoxidase subunit PaaE
VRRNYSLCVAPQDGQLKVTVKRIAGGVFSNWANDNLKPGDPMEVMEPHGSFTWEFRAGRPQPLCRVRWRLRHHADPVAAQDCFAERAASKFTLFYGNRDSQSVIFLEELASLKNRFMNRLQIHHFLAEEAEEIELFNGMLDRTKCDLILGSLIEPEEISAFFICGPGPMMDAAEEALTAVGVPADRILVERFTAGRPSAALAAQMQELQTQAAGLTMQVTLDGRTRRVAFNAEAGNILDSARLAGLPAPFRLQGRRLRHLPRPRHQGRGRDGRPLRPLRPGNRRRLRPHLPVRAEGRRRRGGLRRLSPWPRS